MLLSDVTEITSDGFSKLLDNVDRLATLVEDHGVLLILTILLGALTIYHLGMIYRGKLVPVKIYQEVKDENDRLQAIMDKEREQYMSQVLHYMGGLKRVDADHGKGGDPNASNQS